MADTTTSDTTTSDTTTSDTTTSDTTTSDGRTSVEPTTRRRPGAGSVVRPQPIGVFALPAGYLLISDDPALDEVRIDLTAGKLPEAFPPALAFYELALGGDLDGAFDAVTGDDLVSEANRLVLDPSLDRLSALLEAGTAAGDAVIVSFAETIGFIVGLRAEPADGTLVDGEFAAMAHAARATLALEQHDAALAIEELELASQAANPVSAAIAGQLMGQMANTQLDEGGAQRAAVTFQAALDLLEGTDLHGQLPSSTSPQARCSKRCPKRHRASCNRPSTTTTRRWRSSADDRARDVRDRKCQPRAGLHHDAHDRGIRPAPHRRRRPEHAGGAHLLHAGLASRPMVEHTAEPG